MFIFYKKFICYKIKNFKIYNNKFNKQINLIFIF